MPKLDAEIRRLHFVEHWKTGTIASNLGVHPDAVRRVLRLDERKPLVPRQRPRMIDPFLPLVRETLKRYPRLWATNIHAMLRERGFAGSARQVRRAVRELRPRRAEAYLRLRAFPGEEAQADWADFGSISVGRGQRRLSAFVMTLSYSRALYVEFFLDQKTENFLFGHQRAFEHFGGVPRSVRIDNLRSAVLERRGPEVRFHPRYLELAGWYHFQPRPCRPARGNEKGRVERSIGFLRESFFAGRSVTTVADLTAPSGVGAIRWPHAVPGLMTSGEPSSRCSKTNNRASCHFLSIPFRSRTNAWSCRARPSTSASTATNPFIHRCLARIYR